MSKAGNQLTRILSQDQTTIVFLHNTDNLAKAKCILSEGFRYESQLTYSTDRINPNDQIEINYFLVERKEYGDYTIIIEIGKKLFKKYSQLAETSDLNFEDIFSVDEPYLSDNDEYVYVLSNYYIKGIFNNKTGEFLKNPVFDSEYDTPDYLENYNKLIR